MRLQGIGPKTVALLYHTLNIRSLDDLEAAAKAGAIRGLKGMGAKKEALILTAIAERRRHAGRHLIGHACETAETLVAWLREAAPDATYDIVGSLRRGAETSGDIDILATNAPAEVLGHFTRLPPGRARARPRRHQGEHPADQPDAGRPAAGRRPSRAARRCSTSPDRRRTTSRCGSARCRAATR